MLLNKKLARPEPEKSFLHVEHVTVGPLLEGRRLARVQRPKYYTFKDYTFKSIVSERSSHGFARRGLTHYASRWPLPASPRDRSSLSDPPSDLVVPPSELVVSPSELVVPPSYLGVSPSELVVPPSSRVPSLLLSL